MFSLHLYLFDLIQNIFRSPPPPASRKKVLKKTPMEKFRRTTSFSSSEDESPGGGREGNGDQKETEFSNGDDRDTPERPATRKCDVRMEKLHKNIVNHKHNQYKTWLDKEEEIKLRKEKTEEPSKPKPNKTARSPKTVKNVKSKPVLSSGSGEDSGSDDILSKVNEKSKKVRRPGGQEDAEETVLKEEKMISLNKSPKGVVSKPSPDRSLKKKSDVDIAKPTFSDSESEEENQNKLVDMLFDMINVDDAEKSKKDEVPKTEVLVEDKSQDIISGKKDETIVTKKKDCDHDDVQKIETKENSLPSILDDPSLQEFFIALKMTVGYDTFEKQLGTGDLVSNLETLVNESILHLNLTPPDHTLEDQKFIDEHGIKLVQVNVGNIRKDDAWSDQNEEYLEKFRKNLGDKMNWCQILKTGLSSAKMIYQMECVPDINKNDTIPETSASSPTNKQLDNDEEADSREPETDQINSASEPVKTDPVSSIKAKDNDVPSLPSEAVIPEKSELPESSEQNRDGSVSSDDTMTISRRSRKSSGSSDDLQISAKSKKSETVRRSVSSDDEVKVSKTDRERSNSSSSDISVKDLVKASTKKRRVSESSDDSIVITRKDKGKSSDRKSGHKDQKSAEKSSKHASHHKSYSDHKKKKHKKDRDQKKQKAIDIPGFKIPKSDKKEKERSKDMADSKRDLGDSNSSPVTPKIVKKQDLEKIVEKSHASDPGLSSILSSMNKLAKSSKKKHKEKKKKKDRDRHKDKDNSNIGIGDSEDDELPMPVPAANDDDDLPLPVPAEICADDLDLPVPVPADDEGTSAVAETGDDGDDHYVDDLPDHTDEAMDNVPTNPPPTVMDGNAGDIFDIPRTDSVSSVCSDEDTSYVSNFPKPVKGVQRRARLPKAPFTKLPLPGKRPDTPDSLAPKNLNTFESSRSGQLSILGSPPRSARKGFGASPRFDDGSPVDLPEIDNGADDPQGNFEEVQETRNSASLSKSKPKPILKEKRETEVSHYSRAKVSFNVSDSDIERTDSDRSRTPSPFLSTNKYYPWLYNNEDNQEEGIQLEAIKIKVKNKDKSLSGQRKLSTKPKINVDTESKKDEEENDEMAAEERERNKGLGKFLDKVISSLKTQNPPAPSRQPPLPPGPPRPVPSPYDPIQARPGVASLPPPPPPPPKELPPSMIPLPPPTPRYDSPEPGEITEETEKLEASSRLPQLRQKWGRQPGPDLAQPQQHFPHQRHSGRSGYSTQEFRGQGEYEYSGRGKRKIEEEPYFGRKRREELNTKRFHGEYSRGNEDYRMLNSYSETQSGVPFDSESSWLDKFLIAWQELISNQEFYVRRDLNKNESSITTPENDLGSTFNEPKLNARVRDLDSGEERALYTCNTARGAAQFTCSVCDVTVTGIRVLQSHMGGKKHMAKLAEYQVIGKLKLLRDY